ncbi:MAG: DNA-directed DNA polymerase II small subunit, partial [Natronomonas sp.]
MSLEDSSRIVRTLADHGYTADREAITLLASADDPASALALAVEATPDDALKLSAAEVRAALESQPRGLRDPLSGNSDDVDPADDPSVSTGTPSRESTGISGGPPVETTGASARVATRDRRTRDVDTSKRALEIHNDMTGRSTGTGEYEDFVRTFRDRYERLAGTLRGRVNHRNASALEASPGGAEAGMIGMIADVRSTASGHWIIDLEDPTGVFPCLVMKDKDVASVVDELLYDEVVAVDGTLSDDGGILFVDDLYFPDVPRTHEPSTADRFVQVALISDVHVGSDEFEVDAFKRFADWLHTPEAESVEYLLIAGDMVEGVGVYPNQDEELEIVDVFEQYDTFSEHLKAVPGDLDIVMIPGNHDAVRLAEPQPG